jgi:glutathione S-transferase
MRGFHRYHGNNALLEWYVRGDIRAMELFIIPMSCSFTAHVACLEAGLTPTLRHVDRATKLLDDGSDYRAIAPQGIVPVVRTEDFQLSEACAVLQYIADRAPEKALAPAPGSRDRYVLSQWLSFVATEVHKKHMWMIFSSKTGPEQKDWARANAAPMLAYVEAHLATRSYLLGETFTVADIYLWWALFIAPHGGLSLEPYPALRAFVERVRARPSIRTVLAHDVPLFQRQTAAPAVAAAS